MSILATEHLATIFHRLSGLVFSHWIALQTSFLHRNQIWLLNHDQIFNFVFSHIFSLWKSASKKSCLKNQKCQTCLTAIWNLRWPCWSHVILGGPFHKLERDLMDREIFCTGGFLLQIKFNTQFREVLQGFPKNLIRSMAIFAIYIGNFWSFHWHQNLMICDKTSRKKNSPRCGAVKSPRRP